MFGSSLSPVGCTHVLCMLFVFTYIVVSNIYILCCVFHRLVTVPYVPSFSGLSYLFPLRYSLDLTLTKMFYYDMY